MRDCKQKVHKLSAQLQATLNLKANGRLIAQLYEMSVAMVHGKNSEGFRIDLSISNSDLKQWGSSQLAVDNNSILLF